MYRVTPHARTAAAFAALALPLAGCASAGPSTDPSNPAPDLLQALPTSAPTSVPPPPSPTTTPTTTKKATPKAKPKPATARPPHRTRTASNPGDTPSAVSADWKPAGGDEFNGGSLDTAKWGTYDSVGGFGNGLRRPEAISQVDGNLRITAKGDTSGGMADSFGQLYGRWEFRARTDMGRGFGSAILLWPDSEKLDDGEIDIMEVPFEKRDLAHFVVHSGSGGNTLLGDSVPGDYSQWHTFAVEWLPDHITWYVDGKKQYEITDKARIPTTPMHLTIQLDQGPKSDWILAPDDTTPPEINLDVDWVHVYAPAAPVTPPPA
jgi:beta-glucanase (GH16 family)